LLNIPAGDIQLRPEFTALFEHANISASHLVTLDDLPTFSKLEETLNPANTRWVLVDHNKLQGVLGSIYGSRVRGVIDHHHEENFVHQETDPEPRVIEKSGSCTSLVIRTLRFLKDVDSTASLASDIARAGESWMYENPFNQMYDARVAKLGLASILVDTANLTAEGKVFPVDQQAVEYLETQIRKEYKAWDRAKFYEEINTAKSGIERLELHDILRKDYKEWTESGKKLGISSVVKPLDFLVSKACKENPQSPKEEAFDTAITHFMHERSISLFAIMTTSTSKQNEFQRQLLVQAHSPAAPIADKFSSQASAELGLENLHVPGVLEYNASAQASGKCPFRKIWQQKDVSKSRKQVAPLLRKAMV